MHSFGGVVNGGKTKHWTHIQHHSIPTVLIQLVKVTGQFNAQSMVTSDNLEGLQQIILLQEVLT